MSSDEVMDDGLHIKPPQPPSRHKDRKRERNRHGHVSKSRKDLGPDGGEGDRRRHERRHHRGGVEDERGRHRERGDLVDRLDRKGVVLDRESSSSSKHRSSGPSRRFEEQGKIIGSSRDVILSEVKKDRRHLELENERALREIERRREKEKFNEDSSHSLMSSSSSSRHRREKRSHRDRERNRLPIPISNEEVEVEEEEEEDIEIDTRKERQLFDARLNLEVQDIDDSASDLEEGEQRSVSANSKEEVEPHGDASDKSDVSSASEHEILELEEEVKPEEKVTTVTSDVSSSSSSSRKSKSDVSSSSSSNSDSDSEQEKGNNKMNGEEEEDEPKPSKISRQDSPPPSPIEPAGADEKEAESVKQVNEDSVENPVILVTMEEDEEDLLPPYYPALQGCRRVEEFQLLNRIEEGTYGVVYRAKEKRTDEVVALKRLKMEKEKDGFPITSLREINTLLKAQHENIVTVREIVVGSNTDKIFLVMDYVEHDLKALMETLKQKGQVFLVEEVKCLMIQLLRAVAHLHDNWILHRDLKTSNLLLSHKGILKVGDFGLAREYGSPLKSYTPIVVTLWYRAPELLLGTKEYSTPIDVWSVGCIFGELLKMEPMFPGKSEANQLNLIFQSLGTPNDRIWPGYTQLPMLQKMTFADYPVNKLKTRFGHLTDQGIDLMNKFLTFNPAKRITAEDALDHAFFKEMPLAIDPSMFPTWPAKSELGHRKAAASPKPPSGGHQFKGLEKDEESSGFFLGGGDARRQPSGAGFSLKF